MAVLAIRVPVQVESLKRNLSEEHELALDTLHAQNALLRQKLAPRLQHEKCMKLHIGWILPLVHV